MTNSMTASSQATVSTPLGELSCELRGVNHRYLDIAPRMPEELRPYESEMRDRISAKLSRGRLDCFIRLGGSDSTNLQPNTEVAAQLQQCLNGQAFSKQKKWIRKLCEKGYWR
jgi:uncharacterized protein (TIGR00255 family)